MIIVVMGVSGSGKTTVGGLLAERLGVPFVEGDDRRPPESAAETAAGPEALAAALTDWSARGESVVLSCSPLSQAQRALLVETNRDVHFVLLDCDGALLRRRAECRRGRFLPPSVFDGPTTAPEPPKGEADVCIVGVDHPPAQIVEAIVEVLEAEETTST